MAGPYTVFTYGGSISAGFGATQSGSKFIGPTQTGGSGGGGVTSNYGYVR